MSEPERFRPFHCGTQFVDWQNRNCCRCKKMLTPEVEEQCYSTGRNVFEAFPCDIEREMSSAAVGDGTIPLAIAKRCGAADHKQCYSWDCPEREPEEGRAPGTCQDQ